MTSTTATTSADASTDTPARPRSATRRRPYHLAAAVLLLLANLVTALSRGVPLVADALTLNQDYSAATQLATAEVTYANTQSELRAYVGSGLASDLDGYHTAAAHLSTQVAGLQHTLSGDSTLVPQPAALAGAITAEVARMDAIAALRSSGQSAQATARLAALAQEPQATGLSALLATLSK
ncbi:MAG: CHASE3 domain-containing protein, partial [Ktedonobacterales bacterium]